MYKKERHPISIGKNIETLRKIRGMKQETLADALGISRQSVSKLEQSINVDEEKLQQIADALGVTKEGLKNFNEDAVVINIENMNDNSGVYQYNFNPIEKIVQLYDALLKSEKEKSAMMESLLKNLKPEN
jgi:transcriptional regulator with XRE-family HTH domain